jgi:hypothetical protein
MSVQAAALAIQAVGAVNSAIGAFYGARSQKLTMKQQASALEYQQRMAQLNQRIVGREAVVMFQEAQKEIGRATAQMGRTKQQAKAAMAARGLQAGVGSEAEVMASMEYDKQATAMAMNAQAVRQRESMMTQRTDIRNQGLMAGVQASGLRMAGKAIMPGQALMGSLLGSAGQMAANWAYSQRPEVAQGDLAVGPGVGRSGRSLRAAGGL